MRTCKTCGVDKPRKDFVTYDNGKGTGLRASCNECNRARWRYTTRKKNLRRVYGITPEDYDEMAKDGCNLCGKKRESNGRNLTVDHDHKTGKIRGILCMQCNTSLGKLGDSVEGLTRALEYLNASN